MKYLPVLHLAQQSEKRFPRMFSQCPDTDIKTFCKDQAPWRERERGKMDPGEAWDLVKNPAF